jgi:ABC-2 type transport system ATP-binding protein
MIYGFIGHNGAGKTTTMRSIVGLTRFDTGEIIINGKAFQNKVNVNHTVGYLPENPSFYDYMSAKEYLNYLNQFSGQSNPSELLEMVGLKKAMNKKIGSYSRGMKQRLGMAAAMMNHPKLLILDEPTSALDPAGRYDLFEMIKSLRDSGSTIILSTHILDDIEKVSDRIGIIKDGKSLKEGKVDEILSSYVNPIYDIKLEKPADGDDRLFFLNKQWITNVTLEGNMMCVVVNNMDDAKKQMLQTLLASKLPVIGYDLRHPSLEYVFMKETRQ